MWSPGSERKLRSGTAARQVSRPRHLAKPRRKPTWLHSHLCLASKDSRRSYSRASLPASPGLVQVAVAAPSGSATVAPQPPRPSAVVARGRTAPGGNFPGTGIRLGPRRRQWRGLRAGRPPDQRSRPRGPDESPVPRGPWSWAGGTRGPLTSLADPGSPAARPRARARSRRSWLGPRAARAGPAPLRERAPESGGSRRAAARRDDAATARASAASARRDAAGCAAGHRPRATPEEAGSRAPRPLEDAGGER